MRHPLFLAALVAATAAEAATVTPLITRDLAGIAGKEGSMITVTLAPGEANPVHRHNANVFVYVLEGAVAMQVKGGPETVLRPGGTFYEAPDDVHVVSRNASASEAARFLVMFVKDKGAPSSVAVGH